VDVGSEYDASRHRYDHHQRGFTVTLNSQSRIKLSSAGLIYKHFGREIIEAILQQHCSTTTFHSADYDLLYGRIYSTFVEALDALDNGIPQYPDNLLPAYQISTDLGSRVGRLNPSWNEPKVDVDGRFAMAMELAGKEFVESVLQQAKSWLPARNIVKTALCERLQHHKSGQVIVLHNYTAWASHIHL